MRPQIDTKRVYIFIAFAFGLSWLTGLVIYLNGGLLDSPELAPGSGFTQAWLLIVLFYMTAPAVAHVLTRLITREGFQDLWLRPRVKQGWRFWVVAWLGTVVLVLAGAVLYFGLFPANFDSELSQLSGIIADLEAQTGQPVPLSPALLLVVQVIQAMLIAPIINLLPVLGEEFGWRAYLQPKLMPLGERKAMVLMGIIWGAWHWPLLALGHAYGLDYPGAPWTGIAAFTWFTFVYGTFMGWATLRAGSVWPAVIGHAVLNGLAGVGALLVLDGANPIVGPTPAGVIGSLGFTIVAVRLLWRGLGARAETRVQQLATGQV